LLKKPDRFDARGANWKFHSDRTKENDHEIWHGSVSGRTRSDQGAERARNTAPGQWPRAIADRTRQDRTSQINGRGVYTKRHAEDAREHGETGERLYALDARREAPFYTDRERGALAWTEAVTLVSERYPRDDVYDEVRKHFSEAEIMNLTMLIAIINVWNWLVVSYRAVPTNPLSRSINSCSFD
jgi:Carboxymuconolactone decarboxylase family